MGFSFFEELRQGDFLRMLDQGPLGESDDQQLSTRVIGININGKGITACKGGTKYLDDGAPS